ncbi:HYC_CC_PP family protein [Flavobacterium sp.]|jgi:hypothetical protein|uniref:HYC_CC_PP family protein n=1 Tax=Flavobacterium sp. TaxID=239 RepID=UPI0037BE4162
MKVRKRVSLFLAIMLLFSNFGLAFNIHFCGDKIASVSSALSTIKTAEFSTTDCCCVKDNQDKKSCCKDKVVDFKKDTKELVVKNTVFQLDSTFAVLVPSEIILAKALGVTTLKSTIPAYYCISNAPPLFKLYNQYLFYA